MFIKNKFSLSNRAPAVIIRAPGPIDSLADFIEPTLFTSYVVQRTMELAAIYQSAGVRIDPVLNTWLASGQGPTINVPFYYDLDNEDENIGDESNGILSGGSGPTPSIIQASSQIAYRMIRNKSWQSGKIIPQLIGDDPMQVLVNLVGYYWARRIQAALLAAIAGVFADNDAAPVGTEHVQGDLTVDVRGVGFSAGVTNITRENINAATLTMGDGQGSLGIMYVHSIVYNTLKNNDLIDTIPDSLAVEPGERYGRFRLIQDDAMPSPEAGVYETWMAAPGAFSVGLAPGERANVPWYDETANNGQGSEVLSSRMQMVVHPQGHRFIGAPAVGGPSNAATANNLANAGSWIRVFKERKQVPFCRLITREF